MRNRTLSSGFVRTEKIEKINYGVKKNLILFITGKGVSLLGSEIYSFALSLYVLRQTGSGMSFAATLFFGLLPRIMLSPIFGILADRFNKKNIIVIMDVFSGCVLLLLYGMTSDRLIPLSFIYSAAFLLSIFSSFLNVTFDSSIPNLVDSRNLMRINSLNYGINSLTAICGPFLGGIIYSFVDIRVFILINGISFLISAFTECFIDFNLNKDSIDYEDNVVNVSLKAYFKDFLEGFIFIKGHKIIKTIIPYSILSNFIFVLAVTVPVPYLLNEILRIEPNQYGLIQGMFSVGVLIGSIVGSFRKGQEKQYKRITVFLLGRNSLMILMSLPFLPFTFSFSNNIYFWFYSTIFCLVGFSGISIDLPLIVSIQREIPDYIRGRVMSLIYTLVGIATPFALILSGFLINHVPVYFFPSLGGIILLIRGIALLKNETIKSL